MSNQKMASGVLYNGFYLVMTCSGNFTNSQEELFEVEIDLKYFPSKQINPPGSVVIGQATLWLYILHLFHIKFGLEYDEMLKVQYLLFTHLSQLQDFKQEYDT